jgi:hypothetical protein
MMCDLNFKTLIPPPLYIMHEMYCCNKIYHLQTENLEAMTKQRFQNLRPRYMWPTLLEIMNICRCSISAFLYTLEREKEGKYFEISILYFWREYLHDNQYCII